MVDFKEYYFTGDDPKSNTGTMKFKCRCTKCSWEGLIGLYTNVETTRKGREL